MAILFRSVLERDFALAMPPSLPARDFPDDFLSVCPVDSRTILKAFVLISTIKPASNVMTEEALRVRRTRHTVKQIHLHTVAEVERGVILYFD